MKHPRSALLAVSAASLALCSPAFAQGTLAPPGPPGPTMQSLDQLGAKADAANTKLDTLGGDVDAVSSSLATINNKTEKRFPITQTSVPLTILQPGSYYLAENIVIGSGKTAIRISVNDVTLDLNGFRISSTSNPPAGDGVHVDDNINDVVIRNGVIAGGITNGSSGFVGPGFANGIAAANSANLLVRDIVVNGCAAGIATPYYSTTTVEHSAVASITGAGIVAGVVSQSTAANCGGAAINARTVQHCYAVSTATAGILGVNVTDSYGESQGTTLSSTGVSANTATNCYGTTNGGTGLIATNATNCTGISQSGTGLYATNVANSLGHAGAFGTTGLLAASTASFSRGECERNGTGLSATIAVACTGSAASGGTAVSATNKYLMP